MSKKRLRKRKAERPAAGYVKTRDPIAYDHAHGPRIKGGVHGGDSRAQRRRERREGKREARQGGEEV